MTNGPTASRIRINNTYNQPFAQPARRVPLVIYVVSSKGLNKPYSDRAPIFERNRWTSKLPVLRCPARCQFRARRKSRTHPASRHSSSFMSCLSCLAGASVTPSPSLSEDNEPLSPTAASQTASHRADRTVISKGDENTYCRGLLPEATVAKSTAYSFQLAA